MPTTESREYVEREHFRRRDIPNPLDLIANNSEVGVVAHYSFGVMFCAVGNLMIAAHQVQPRELALHEAWEVALGCVLPFFGRAVVHRIFFDHPEWDDLPMGPPYTYEEQIKVH